MALKPDFHCGGRKKRKFVFFSFALNAFPFFALFFLRAIHTLFLASHSPIYLSIPMSHLSMSSSALICLFPSVFPKIMSKNIAAPTLFWPCHRHKFSLMGWLHSFLDNKTIHLTIQHSSIKECSLVITNILSNLPTGLYFHHQAEQKIYWDEVEEGPSLPPSSYWLMPGYSLSFLIYSPQPAKESM